MMFLLTCDKKLTKSQLSPTHASTKRKITDELKQVLVLVLVLEEFLSTCTCTCTCTLCTCDITVNQYFK